MDQEFSKARIKKDRNFDGKFFFGVQTTGIFCRPSCPSPIAKEENVQYFNTIFEALELGFRPCLRCRPDVKIEYSNGNIAGSSLVHKALKMIYDGYLNYNSLQQLAGELHVSDRHLRNLFVENLGVPPVKIARYHKILFAKKLLTSSTQSITNVALASGFRSIRQFNDTFKEIFKTTPTKMRESMDSTTDTSSQTTLLLSYKKPFNFEQILSFMRLREMKGLERVTSDSYSRTFRTKNTRGHFTVRDNSNDSALELSIVCDDIKCFMEIHNRVRRMFDLDTDFSAINDQLSKTPVLRRGMPEGITPRMPIAFDPFEFVIRAILGQQVTVKAATTMAARIAAATSIQTGDNFPNGLDIFFPTPSELAHLDLSDLGLTRTRQATIRTVTQAVLQSDLELRTDQSFEEFHAAFTALKGIGDWTANYIAMRALGMLDAFPADDLGVIKALTKNGHKPNKKEILKQAEKWQPYRSYATLCLWNTLHMGEKK